MLFKYLLFELRKRAHADRTYFQTTIRWFSKRQIIFRLQVKGWRSWRRPRVTDVRDTSLSHHNSSALHTYVWKWFWFMGRRGLARQSRNWRVAASHGLVCAGGGWRLSRLGHHPDTDRAFIYTTATLRKVCYCLLNTLMSVCHPAIDLCRRHQLVSHIIRGCGLTFVQNVRRSSTVVLLTDWWYQLRYPKLFFH